MADETLIHIERDGAIATVTLNRPAVMNALSVALRRQMAEAFDRFSADGTTRVVILTGAGERAFCAGLDLKELGDASSGRPKDVLDGSEPLAAMARFSGPIIGAINGVAVTGGMELALACDVLIGSTNARFADTHARIGLMPGWGMSQKLSRLIGISRSKEMSLTGNFISAQTALEWGLLNRIVAPDELMAAAQALAADMASCIPETQAAMKKLIDQGFDLPLGEAMKLEAETAKQNHGSVDAGDIAARRNDVRARGSGQV